MTTSGISFFGQTQTQINRLKTLQVTMQDLQRQVTTQKKHDTMAGFGLEAQRVLQLRGEKAQLEIFNKNIETTLDRVVLMNDTLNTISDSVRDIINEIRAQPRGAGFDMSTINIRAQELLDFVIDLTNVELDGRSLFSGTDARNAPFENKATLNTNFQNETADWLAGTQTTAQFLADGNALSGTNLGFSNTITGATNVTVRIDTSLELSYGALADRSGVEEAMRVLGYLANLQNPADTGGVPTEAEFFTVIDDIVTSGLNALDQISDTQISLISKMELMQNVQETHQKDINLFTILVDKEENADTTEVIAQLQSLQTQITASYEVTRVVSELSLVNFI